MSIRSLLVAVACTLPLASFIVAGTHAEAEEAAEQLQCPPYCPNQDNSHDRSRERHKAGDRSHERRNEHDRFRKRHNEHERFRKRHDDDQPHFDKPHRKSHRHHKRSHSGGKVRLRFYPRYYDPYSYDPYSYDPFYNDRYYDGIDEPDYTERLTCKEAIAELRHNGYRNVKAFDCRGESYGFYATRGGKKYKIIMSSFDGDIISRKRITR